jgi:transposase
MKLIRVGVDLAKNVFQVHGVDRNEKPVWRRRLTRSNWLRVVLETVEPGCQIGMEACSGAHHWARKLQERGYTVKLGDGAQFANGRQMAAVLGLTPKQHSSGGKDRQLGISKRGDAYLRMVLIHGARSAIRTAKAKSDRLSLWVRALLERRHPNVVAAALANKTARIAWAMLRRGSEYRPE